jgi:hypothetical protein
MYSRQVQQVLAAYPPEQVLVLQYERCVRDFEQELDRTYRFMGVQTGVRPAPWGPEEATTSPSDLDVGAGDLGQLYAADAVELARLVPEIDLTLWPSVRDLV